MEMQTKTIDMTPTWSEILGTVLVVLRDGDAEGKKFAVEELKRMAILADRYVDGLKGQRKAMQKLRDKRSSTHE